MKKPTSIIYILLSCVLIFLASCTSQNREAGYIYYRLNTTPTTLDPALIVDVTGGSIVAKLFNGLVRIGDNLKIVPDLAETWSISSDGLLYTFRIRKGVRFSNNREVKADDVKYSFQRILEPKSRSPNTWVFEKIAGAEEFLKGRADTIQGIRVLDDYTLEIRLRKPFSPFLKLLAMTAAYVVPGEEVEKWGPDFSSHPVGTGPFVLDNWMPNREIRLVKRADYFDRPANVRGIIYRIIPEDLTAVTEFELGNLDVFTIPASEFSRYRKNQTRNKYISSIQGLDTYYIGLNCDRPPFDNPVLRRAMNYSIDRVKILDTIYEKRGRIANGPLPDMLRKWDMPARYGYNPEKSREMIKSQGLNGITVTLYITAEQEIIDIAEVLQSYIESAGIHVKIKQLEWSAYKEAINNGEPDMFYLSWWADYPDPENFLFPLFHSSNHGAAGNRTRFTDHVVDSLIEKGQASMNVKQRDEFYQRAEERIVDDAPWVFLWHRTDFTIRQPWVKNYKIYTIYSMDKGTELSF